MSVVRHLLHATDTVPNSKHPLLIFRQAFPASTSAEHIEASFTRNGWTPQWRFPMYRQFHYHSTTHESLGFAFAFDQKLTRASSAGPRMWSLAHRRRIRKGVCVSELAKAM